MVLTKRGIGIIIVRINTSFDPLLKTVALVWKVGGNDAMARVKLELSRVVESNKY
jgi:hypothetical protein